MKLIIAFLPWIIFGALSHHYPLAALLVALAMTAVQVLAHRRNPKILEMISLCFFIFDFVALYFMHWAAIGHHQGLIVHLLLAAIAWGSLLAGNPFTLPYARESAPPERWNLPSFVRANQWITAVWGTDFILQAAVLEWQAARSGLFPSLISITLSALSLLFTFWYPGKVRRRDAAEAAATQEAVAECPRSQP
jgi:all-trans-retinol 13,14-reductase